MFCFGFVFMEATMVIIPPSKFAILVSTLFKRQLVWQCSYCLCQVTNSSFILTVYLCPVGISGHIGEDVKVFSMKLASTASPSNSSWRITAWTDPETSCISSVPALRAAEVSQQESLLSHSMFSLGKGD